MLSVWTFRALSAAVLLSTASSASAAVSLFFTDNVPPSTQGTALRGSSFFILLNLNSTAEQTTGLNYFMRAPGAGSGFFSIKDRNISGSPYSDLNNSDASVEAAGAAALNDSNDLDLGATVPTPVTPLPTGTHFVATYEIAVSPSTPLGTYTIETFSLPGTGANLAVSPFDVEFSSHATYSVTVLVPEPGSAALAGIVAAGLLARRSRRSA